MPRSHIIIKDCARSLRMTNTAVLLQNRILMVVATTGQELAMWMMLPLLEKHLQTPSYVVKSFCDCTNWPTMLSKQVTL